MTYMKIFIVCLITAGSLLSMLCTGPVHAEDSPSPFTVERVKTGGDNIYVTFLNTLHPGNRVGYRFFEGGPRVVGKAPSANAEAGIDPARVAALEAAISARPGVKIFRQPISGENWISHQWTYYMAPAEDGIDLLWVIETSDEGLPQHYAVTQCFRLGGYSYRKRRHNVALTPAFSEHDLWKKQEAAGKEKTSLTHVVRGGAWEAMPSGWPDNKVFSSTPWGLKMGHKGNLKPVDIGLITRVNLEGTWLCGIYWERATRVACHWPADCLHPYVDVGNVPPKSKRAIRGKIYWFEGTKKDLLERCRKDFGDTTGTTKQERSDRKR